MQILTDFVEAQASYFDQCNQHTQDLQKHLARCVHLLIEWKMKFKFPHYLSSFGFFLLQNASRHLQLTYWCFYRPCSIPAVLCSNNWQSAGGSEVSQQSSGNHVATEPGRLRPHAINVHQLPEFDQDSWTVNAPPGTEKTSEDVPPLDLHNNNNNNNNNALTPGQAMDQESRLEPCPADPISEGARTHTAMASPSERSGTSKEAATTDMAAVTVTTSSLGENQPMNEAQAINGEGVQVSPTRGGDVAP